LRHSVDNDLFIFDAQGRVGPHGLNGAQGLRGPQGERGLTGDRGPPGEPGVSCSCPLSETNTGVNITLYYLLIDNNSTIIER